MKKTKFSKKIVTLVVLMNASFTVAVLYIFYKTGSEPPAIIAGWFGFSTLELAYIQSIKKKEASYEYRSNRNNNSDDNYSDYRSNNDVYSNSPYQGEDNQGAKG